MSKIIWFTDEDVYAAVAVALRAAGDDSLSTPEANRLGETDEAQLEFATREGRVLVSFNVSDFARLHHAWLSNGKHHAGVIVSGQRPIGDVVKRLLNLASQLSADEMCDRLEYLSNW